MDLIKLYESILRFSGFETDNEGYIYSSLAEHKQPAFIEGCRLVLPVNNHLRNFKPNEKIIFHPFSENILRGESKVLQKLKHTINVRLNYTIGMIAQSLLNLVASPELHSKLSPEQLQLLVAVSEADEKTVLNFLNQIMVPGIKAKPDSLFTHIYLKRGGQLKGKNYARLGVTTFAFYREITAEHKVYEKLRVKDRETYKNLFEFMFPGIGTNPDAYNFGTDGNTAPYLEALLQTAALTASQLNLLLTLYSDYIENHKKLMFDSDWLDFFGDLSKFESQIRRIPVQTGNDGELTVIEEPVVATEKPAVPSFSYPTQAPVQMPGVPQAPSPELKVTKQGIDFKSLVQSNPGLVGGMNPGMMNPAMRPQMMPVMQQAYTDPNNVPMNGVIQTPNGPMVMTPGGLMPYQQPQQFMNYGQQPQQFQSFNQPQQQNIPMNTIVQTPNGPMVMTPGGLVPYQQQTMANPYFRGL